MVVVVVAVVVARYQSDRTAHRKAKHSIQYTDRNRARTK
jgi:hypothetical protein